MKLIFDMDAVVYPAASIAEERFITTTHTLTGIVREFENRTAFYGDWRKKVGGFIGLQNELSGDEYYKAEDFTVVDEQRLRPFRVKGFGDEPDTFLSPLDGAKKYVNDKIRSVCNTLKTESYIGFTGTGRVFRHDVARLLEYKGNRNATARPLLLSELKGWVCEAHNTTMITGFEADDAVSAATVQGYKNWVANGRQDEDVVINISAEKDSWQVEGHHYHLVKGGPVTLIEGLGSLWLNEKGDVVGNGRMWLYMQCSSEDNSDHYAANSFSDIKWGPKSAYKALKDCATDKQAFESMVGIFKKLYPEPKTVEGCKGSVDIDWLFVFQECMDMAFMCRHLNSPRDRVVIKDVLDKMGISYAD